MPNLVNKQNILVSVILPVYNCERFIGKAIESILNQTYENIELIVIDDGSNDNSLNIINSYSYDSRLFVISRENKGLVHSLNEGVALASGKYIARMDADDISVVDRIEKQVAFFCKNKDVAVVGSRTILIDENDIVVGRCHRPLSDVSIKAYFYYGSGLAHPSIMYNLNVLSKNEIVYFSEDYPAEDLGLFLRISQNYKIYNIKEALLKYRLTKSGVSSVNKINQQTKSNKLRISHFSTDQDQVAFISAIDMDLSVFNYYIRLTRSLVGLLFSKNVSTQHIIPILAVYLKALRRKFLA